MKAVFVAGGTGGHVYPALAVAREYKKNGSDIFWIGGKSSLEEKLALEENFFFKGLQTTGFRGKGPLEKIFSIFNLISSFITSIKILKKIKPDFIFSSGGFVSLGPGIASFFLNIPLFIHEQNSVAGSTNKLLSKISYKIFAGFPSSFKKREKVEFVGNPIRDEITNLIEQVDSSQFNDKKFNLLILGGSQGSYQLNSIVLSCYKHIGEIKNWKITHQTGKSDISRLIKFYSKLDSEFRVESFIEDIGQVYKEADLIVSRAGAMTLSEIIAMEKPSILLPLPWATDNHQFLNATYLKELGASEIVISEEKNSYELALLISNLANDKEKRLSMSNSAKLAFIPEATKQIFTQINESIEEKS